MAAARCGYADLHISHFPRVLQRQVYADVLRRWRLIVPLAELTKFGPAVTGPEEKTRECRREAAAAPASIAVGARVKCVRQEASTPTDT